MLTNIQTSVNKQVLAHILVQPERSNWDDRLVVQADEAGPIDPAGAAPAEGGAR